MNGGRGGIRTRDLRLRRPTLYPAELPARYVEDHLYHIFGDTTMAIRNLLFLVMMGQRFAVWTGCKSCLFSNILAEEGNCTMFT